MSTEATSSVVPNAQTYQAIYIGPSQNLAIGAVSAQSVALSATASIVRLCADADCFVAIGPNPTATSSGCWLQAGLTEYFGCNGSDKVAVLQKSAAGNLNIVEGA